WRRRQFQPLLVDVAHVSPCYAYRGKGDTESEDQNGERLAKELEAEIQKAGPQNVIAFVAETVVGATLGAVPPVRNYFRRVREVCDRHGILLNMDEVMWGMGPGWTLWAFEQEGIVPHLVATANGLGPGYQPIGEVMVSRKVSQAIIDGSQFIKQGHT